MVPTIAQQLQSLRQTMAETIIPALPADAGFAQEQAGLMLATLDWLADVQAHAYRYEVVENAEYRALLSELVAIGDEGDQAETVRVALDAPAPPAAEALPAPADLSAQNAAMKELAGRLFEAHGADERAQSLVRAAAARQGEREAAWFRLTGFPREPGEIGAVLA